MVPPAGSPVETNSVPRQPCRDEQGAPTSGLFELAKAKQSPSPHLCFHRGHVKGGQGALASPWAWRFTSGCSRPAEPQARYLDSWATKRETTTDKFKSVLN